MMNPLLSSTDNQVGKPLWNDQKEIVRLLKLMEKHNPESLSELAQLSGRQPSNLSRTLKTLERYGLVELKRNEKTLKPIAKATAFDIQYAIL